MALSIGSFGVARTRAWCVLESGDPDQILTVPAPQFSAPTELIRIKSGVEHRAGDAATRIQRAM